MYCAIRTTDVAVTLTILYAFYDVLPLLYVHYRQISNCGEQLLGLIVMFLHGCACSLEEMCDTIRLYHRYNDEQLCDVTALKPNTLVVAKYPGTEDEE